MRGLKLTHSGITFIIYEMAGILGMLACGYISDKLFKSKRAPVSILCMLIVALGVLIYWLSPYIIINHLALLVIGMCVYGPIMLIGVQILDIIPKKAVGTAIGLIGLFGYWGGTTIATIGFGYIIDFFGWRGGFLTLFISCLLAVFFLGLTLKIKSVSKPISEQLLTDAT